MRLNYEKNDLGKSFALAVFVAMLASLALGSIFGFEPTGFKFWLMQGLYSLLIGASAFVYAGISHTNVVTATKLNQAPKWAHLLWGCGAAIFLIAAMTPLNNWILDGIEKMLKHLEQLIPGVEFHRPSVNMPNDLAGLLIVACVLPCFTEEIVFRGTVGESLYDSKSKLYALVVSGALFSLFHANPAQTVHQFVLGCFLTLLVFRSGSLWTSVIVHFFNNAAVVALSYTPLDTVEFWDWQTNKGAILAMFIVGLVGFGLCVFGYLKTTKSTWVTKVDVESVETNAEQNKKTDVVSIVMLVMAIVTCAALWVTSLFS